MSDSREKRPDLSDGTRIHLHRGRKPVDQPIAATIDRFANGCIWVKGSSGSLSEGDSILLEYKIEDDGRYVTEGEVEERLPDSTFIKYNGEWKRIQDRSYVRISTHGLELRVPRMRPASRKPDAPLERCDERFDILDVSAGGLRFESRETFEIGEECVCSFELPGQSCYVIPGQVVRCIPKPGSRIWHEVAMEFQGLDESHRSELLRWIYQEQARRHRNARSE